MFVGRLSAEKGVATLLDAWEDLRDVPLRIVGNGPLEDEVRERVATMPQVELLGRLSREETDAEIGRAALLVFPSEWYETFGRVAIEAYAKGTPVLAADIGAVAEVAGDPAIARRYPPGDAGALRQAVRELLADPEGLAAMGARAREAFVAHYTGEANLVQLEAVYAEAMRRRDQRLVACGESAAAQHESHR